jgi:ferric-dicitrate binding protein FerR (iron transport regulator)
VTLDDDQVDAMRRRSKGLSDEAPAAIGREPAESRAHLDAASRAEASIDRPHGAEWENEARRSPNGRKTLTTRPSPDLLPRLGLSEYILLGLIALGIAITVVVALLNP